MTYYISKRELFKYPTYKTLPQEKVQRLLNFYSGFSSRVHLWLLNDYSSVYFNQIIHCQSQMTMTKMHFRIRINLLRVCHWSLIFNGRTSRRFCLTEEDSFERVHAGIDERQGRVVRRRSNFCRLCYEMGQTSVVGKVTEERLPDLTRCGGFPKLRYFMACPEIEIEIK